jgi:purine-nucleoside phosphorylase
MSALEEVRSRAGDAPIEMGLILGSGLGSLADTLEDAVSIPFGALEGMPISGVSGHAGAVVVGHMEGRRVAILSGRVHYYEQGNAKVMQPAVQLLKDMGAKSLLLTNAAGSTRMDLPPQSLMLITDHINYSGMNPLIGDPEDARFVNMVDAYDPALQSRMRRAAGASGVDLKEGVYAWFSGPSFETPAEVKMIGMLGADAVGMSTVPETILARRIGLKVAAVSLITNLGAGLSGQALSHDETKTESAKAKETFSALIRAYVKGE